MRVGDLVPWQGGKLSRRPGEDQLRREMNRLFEDFFRGSGLESGLSDFTGVDEQAFAPSVNVTENEKAFEVSAELPGMAEEDIEVVLGRSGLTIQGEKREEQQTDEENYFRRERAYGYFQRTIPLPVEHIDQDNVSAEFDRGVLTVTLPKQEKASPTARQIQVKSG